MKIHDQNLDLETCHILFEILNSDLRPDCICLIYLRYIDSKVEKNANVILVPSSVRVHCQSHY